MRSAWLGGVLLVLLMSACSVAFDPDRGVVAPAFHLPGQGALYVLHGPLALPE